jgi:hypothetical protein
VTHTAEQLLSVQIGDSIDDVKRKLNIRKDPDEYTEEESTPRYYDLPEDGTSIYFSPQGRVETIHYEKPFVGRVEGIRIGDSADAVRKRRGKPDRKWPIPDGVDRWLYDGERFLRIDFSSRTGRVEHIFR